MLKKFTSRKFILSLYCVVIGLISLLGFSNSTIEFVTSSLVTVIPSIIYIITEGRIDKLSLEKDMTAINTLMKDEK